LARFDDAALALHYVEEATSMGTNERMRRLYAHHLGREERVLASVRGTVETGRGEPWTGLLLATDRRLAFIANDEASYLPYSAIERVTRGESLLGSYIELYTGGHEVRIKWISARRVRPFVRTVRAAVRHGRPRRRWRSAARPVS
jgi:PH (Pleckstrin Homology) domain-containing protein